MTGPWQYHAEPSKLFYPFGTGPVYHPQHLGYGAIDHTRQSIRGAEHFEATEALRDQDTMSREAEQPALVAPSEVFYRHSPVPTLSECSTRSTSSSLKSSFGSMGWDEGPVLHSVPASSRPWDSFEPDNLYGRTPGESGLLSRNALELTNISLPTTTTRGTRSAAQLRTHPCSYSKLLRHT